MRFEAPRGTHDILPAEQPRWRWVTGEVERALRALRLPPDRHARRSRTPSSSRARPAAARTSSQKEMYTFADRGGRSLTLRPEATAPIARAYLEHGLHREPQPQKLYTIAPMYRYAAPAEGAATASTGSSSVEAIGTDDPAIDAEMIQLYAEPARAPRRHATTRSSSTRSATANCRPAYVERLRPWLDEHEAELDEDARDQRATQPAARLRHIEGSRRGPGGARARRRRSATRSATRAASTSPQVRALPRRVRRRATSSCRRSCAASTTTRARPSSSSATRWARRASLCGGGRYDGLVEELGGKPTPGIGFGAGIERLAARARRRRPSAAGGARRRRLLRRSRTAPTARRSSPAMLDAARRPGCARTPTTPAARSRAS